MAPAKDRKQIREIRLRGAPLGVIRVRTAWPARALRCDWRAELRLGIASATKTRLDAYNLLDVRPVYTS